MKGSDLLLGMYGQLPQEPVACRLLKGVHIARISPPWGVDGDAPTRCAGPKRVTLSPWTGPHIYI